MSQLPLGLLPSSTILHGTMKEHGKPRGSTDRQKDYGGKLVSWYIGWPSMNNTMWHTGLVVHILALNEQRNVAHRSRGT